MQYGTVQKTANMGGFPAVCLSLSPENAHNRAHLLRSLESVGNSIPEGSASVLKPPVVYIMMTNSNFLADYAVQ